MCIIEIRANIIIGNDRNYKLLNTLQKHREWEILFSSQSHSRFNLIADFY